MIMFTALAFSPLPVVLASMEKLQPKFKNADLNTAIVTQRLCLLRFGMESSNVACNQ